MLLGEYLSEDIFQKIPPGACLQKDVMTKSEDQCGIDRDRPYRTRTMIQKKTKLDVETVVVLYGEIPSETIADLLRTQRFRQQRGALGAELSLRFVALFVDS